MSTRRQSTLSRGITVAIATLLGAACAASAKAACPSSMTPRVAGVSWSDGPLAARARLRQVSLAYAAHDDDSDREPSIVGLWKVAFLAGGQVIDQGFDAWHADGTETLNDFVPPTTGNVCLGVWERTGARTYKLKHLSWNYDANGNAIGIVVIHELVKLDRSGNSYQGTLTVEVFDLHDTLLFQDSGELTGRRITAD